jgi:hypothetical protein
MINEEKMQIISGPYTIISHTNQSERAKFDGVKSDEGKNVGVKMDKTYSTSQQTSRGDSIYIDLEMRANGILRVIPSEDIEIPDSINVNKTELFEKVFSI